VWLPVLIPLSKGKNMGEIPGPSGLQDWSQMLMVTRTANTGGPPLPACAGEGAGRQL
jgi:hypothetical protein